MGGFEVYNAPPNSQALIGKVVRLEWSKEAALKAKIVTRDVHFTAEAIESQRTGNLHPSRLNGRSKVGSLQSLAGARPKDDVVVALGSVKVIAADIDSKPIASLKIDAKLPVLQITAEPTQVTGQFYGLVKILGSAGNSQDVPKACPGDSPCPSEDYQVVHYNATSKKFDGIQEVIRIPQVLPSVDQLFQSTPRDLEKSAVGIDGWYIYGARSKEGLFVVQALQPRSLMRLKPDQILLGERAGLNYIRHHQWQEITKGTLKTVLIDPQATRTNQALEQWKEGDRALLIHSFGGIGGNKAEPNPIFGTITGHFAYGLAEVGRDRFTQELQFKIRYFQVYSHNPNGIVAGVNSWANYMGNLQRGWLGTRPVADVLVKWDALTQDYDFGGIKLSPMWELQQQLSLMMARYRIGDGTGAALVTPASSCVQDSSQAVYRTIKSIEAQISTQPAIQAWLKSHPDHPQTQRFRQLAQFSRALERDLVPLGMVRPDWRKNADQLAGIRSNFVKQDNGLTQLLSWRTALPKVAHDQMTSLFLHHGAALWVLRTNQVGGWDADIAPLAPTQLLGQFYIIPNTFSRLIEAFKLPNLKDWLIAIALLLLYGLIAAPIGFQQQFLHLTMPFAGLSRWEAIGFSLKLLWLPAIAEEIVFRVLLIPHPTEGADLLTTSLWAIASLVLFVVYHPLNAITFYYAGYPTFFRSVFLLLSALLGLTCTVAYLLTGSLWAIAFIHWIVVLVWLQLLGGLQKLGLQKTE